MYYLIRIWMFCRKYKLKTRKREVKFSVEFLRQQFLLDNPQYRVRSTQYFIWYLRFFLKFSPDKEDGTCEDGTFYINPTSILIEPPPATKELPPLPEGWEDCV